MPNTLIPKGGNRENTIEFQEDGLGPSPVRLGWGERSPSAGEPVPALMLGKIEERRRGGRG